MGPHEPYWRTNTSFSPPPTRWDLWNHSEGQSFGSQDGNQLYGSSTSANSRESRSWLRGSYLPNHHRNSVSDGVGPYITSPSEFSPAQQCTTPVIQEISVNDFGNSSRTGNFFISSFNSFNSFPLKLLFHFLPSRDKRNLINSSICKRVKIASFKKTNMMESRPKRSVYT